MKMPADIVPTGSEPRLTIDPALCIGCGRCAQICIRDNIEIVDKKAVETCTNCFGCGHCLAVCPKGAIHLIEYPGFVPSEFDGTDVIAEKNMAAFLSQRRSCRFFKHEKVTRQEFERLFEAAGFSPSGQNAQDVEYAVIDDSLNEFMEMIGDAISVYSNEYPRIAQFQRFRKDPSGFEYNPLLWEGKQIICAFSEEPVDSAIGLGRIEMVAYSMGLGGFYSLFISKASKTDNEKVLQFFPGISKEKSMQAVFVIGRPRIRFSRTVPRRPIKVHWM